MHRKSRLRAWFPAILASTLAIFVGVALVPIDKAEAVVLPYVDRALWVDGTSNHPIAYSVATLGPSSGDYTVEMWATFEGATSTGSSYYLWQFQKKGLYVKNGTFWWLHDDGSNTDTGVTMPSGWFDVAVSVTSVSKVVKLFLNGSETSWSKAFSQLNYTDTSGSPNNKTTFGGDANLGSPWNGQLDQVKVFSSALTASQLNESKDTYKTAGMTVVPTLTYHYDMNNDSSTLKQAGILSPDFSAPTGSFSFKDVKTVDTTSRPNKTIFKFPRTYLNAEGGFKLSGPHAATIEYLAVAGGGGGGGNRGGGGGAGGLLSGNVTMPYNGAFQVIVGSGGYSSANGSGTVLKNVNATTNIISTTGGGAGGTHGGNVDGASGGSGGGASMCYGTTYPQGGAALSGQGYNGAGSSSSICVSGPPESRHTGGGGGSGSDGVIGYGGSDNPSASTPSMTRPTGGSGTSSSISGTATFYAAGGGGAVALLPSEAGTTQYYSSFFGLGGSSTGGDGAEAGARGANAIAFTGSGGGGGGNLGTSADMTSGGYGSGGILYLVASAGPVLTTPAAGALLNSPTMIQPTVTVPTGTASITGCSAVDANGSSVGVSVSCTPVTSSTSSATLTDLKFTNGTTGQYYTVIFTINGFDEIRQEMYLGYKPANITIAASGATSNFVWDGNAIVASADNADIVVLNTDVQSHLNTASIALHASSKIQQSTSSPISGSTSGNGILLKANLLQIRSNLTTTNGAVTFWSTNPNAATGTSGVTGVLLDSSVVVSSSGGTITVGGGSDPFTEPVTAEVGFKMNGSSKLNAADGNISIRANSVANSSLSSGANFQMGAMMMVGSNVISTTGSGNINISVQGDGVGDRVAYGLAMWSSGDKITAVNGDINISAGNLGAGSVLAFSIDSSGEISTSGTGNITIVGDGRGSSSTTTANPGIPVYGVAIGLTSSGTGRSGTYNKIKTVDGNISITGYGSSHAGTSVSYSIPGSIGIWNYGFIQSTGAGNVSLSGYGGDIAQGSTFSEQSLGIEQTGLVSATTGAITLTGKAGVVSGTPAGKAYGIVASKSNYTETYLPGTIQTTSGSITISGDTSGAPSGTNSVQQAGYFEQSGQKIISTSGSISLTGAVCSTCSSGADYGGDSYGVVSYSFGTGTTAWHEITTGGAGNINIVGRVDKKISTTSSIAYGVYIQSDGKSLRNTISTSDGNLAISGTAAGKISKAISLLQIQMYSRAGNLSVSGTASGSGAGGFATSVDTATLKTLSGAISVTGKNVANVAAGTMGNNTGLLLNLSTIKSGDSAASPPISGGVIDVEGQVPEDTAGTLIGISWSGTDVDTYNGTINVLANASSSVVNANRTGLKFHTGGSAVGATSSVVNVKVYGSGVGSSAIYQESPARPKFGGIASHANVTIETDAWNTPNGTGQPTDFDTDGWVEIKPIGTSFKASNKASTTTPVVMTAYFIPTVRISKFTIGKPGNTTGFTFPGLFEMSTDASNPSIGNLVIYAGTVDSGVAGVRVNTLSLESSGEIKLPGSYNNIFNRVAVVRGSASNFALQNSSTSWQAGNFNGVTGVYGVPAKLKFVGTQPTTTPANTATSFSVQAADAYDVAIASANSRGSDPITVSVSRASGASTSLGGTSTVSGTAGTAQTFSDITFDQKGIHTISFDATGYSQLVSSNINVTNGPPTYNLSYFGGTNTTTFVSSTTTASPSLTTATTGAKTWSVLPAGSTVCSINSTTGVVTTLSAGTCQVKLATALDANYSASSVTITLTINKSNQASLVISTTSGTYGTTLALSTGSSGSGTGAVTFTKDSGTCSLSGSTLTLGNAGDSCMVTATKAGDDTYNEATSISASITTNKASQASLVVPSGVSLTYGDSVGITLSSLSITGGSGAGSLSFSTSTVGCSITSGVLTSTKDAGTSCVVTTTKASETNYNSASVDLTVSISKASQAALTITSTSGTYGSTVTLTTSGGTDNGSVTYVVDSGTCSVLGATLTLGDAGTSCMVTATKASTTNYNSVSSSSTSISTAKADQAILAITSTNGTYGTALTLTTSGGTGGGSVTFVVDSGTCSVTAGVLSLGGAGDSCMVTATKASTTNYNSVTSASTSIATAKANQVNLVAPSGVSLTYGDSSGLSLSSLVFTGGSGSGAISFTTSTPGCSIASAVLTSSNNATTICTVSGTKAGDSNYNIGNAANLSVTIARAAQPTISITSASTGTWGTDITLTSSGSVGDGALTYSVVSGSICSVTGTATLASTGAGTCVIKASVAQGTNHLAGSSANFTVTLAKKNQATLGWPTGGSAINTTIDYGATRNLSTTGGSGTGTIVYTRSASSECTVIGNVVLASADAGSVCEIVATKVADSNYYSADSATLTFTIAKIAQASISWTNASSLTYGQTLNLNAIGGSGDGNISYGASGASNTAGCSVTGSSLSVTSSGSCTVTAQKASSTNYLQGSQIALAITVNKAIQTVAFTSTVPATPIVGDTYSLSAQVSSGGTAAFSVVSGGCSVTAANVTFTGAGNCLVAADVSSTSQYLAASRVTQTIAVGQQNQTLTFATATLNVTTKTFGDTAFVAQASSSVTALAPVFTRGSNTTNNACLVTSSGVVSVVAVGTCEILADQPGDTDTAAASTISKTFQVVADLANAPAILSVSAGHQSITAAFVKPSYTGGASVTGYELVATYASGSVSYDGCAVVAGSDQSCTISGLDNGTPYTVKVAAINSAGKGAYSNNSASRTPATNPAAVSAFTAIPDNTRLVLSWQDPISLGGGTFDSYRIFYKRSSDASYPGTYITVNSQSPTGYTITGLINGEAYDAKIVTVTTANTVALESNTAEVRETPRTVPDAPALVTVFEAGANLVISWLSPVSDGGAAITAYAATISGTSCVLATPTDTTCTISAPSAPGVYAIEVKARNDAGYSSGATQTFVKAGVPANQGSSSSSNPGSTNGGNEYAAPGKPQMQVISFSLQKFLNSGGQKLSLVTRNMNGLNEVLVNGIKARILTSSDTFVSIVMPKSPNGPATLLFRGANGHLEIVDAVTYVNGKVKPAIVSIKGYVQTKTTLLQQSKVLLKKALASSPGTIAVTCIGYQSWAYDTPLDAQTAIGRAKQACAYLKSLNPSLSVKSVIARTNLTGTPSRKLAVQFRAIK